MKTKQVSISKNEYRLNHELLDTLIKFCYIDTLTGSFHCKKCNSIVHIDWYRTLAFCSYHGLLH